MDGNAAAYWPRWFAARWFSVGVLLLLSLGACRRSVPVVDTAPKPLQANGTISGTIRGPEGTTPVDGRVVEAVNIETGDRQRATTNTAGGFSFKVKRGKYRVHLTLHDGESIVRQPGVIDVDRSDGDPHADFVVGSLRVARPRYPVYRIEPGLGAPIA